MNIKNISNIINEDINKLFFLIKEDKGVNVEDIIEYVKSFASGKGKLESCKTPLELFYKPYLEKAYEWASEKLYDIKRDGFAYFKHLFKAYVVNNFKLNKRGLIYVEREIKVSVDKGTDELSYKSIGECWSWRRGNSSSYCSDFGINDKTYTVMICGYVHPSSVDWLETVYLNSYDMKNETEIRMNDNAFVEVSYIKINSDKYRLGGSYLINASSDKYRKKEW